VTPHLLHQNDEVGSIYTGTSNTLHHLKELRLDSQQVQ